MSELSIGRLKGRFVVSWWEDGKRRRYRLEASDRKAAESEAVALYRRETANASDTTVKSLWDAYRKEKAGRRVAEAMRREWKAVGPYFGELRPEDIDVDVCRGYTKMRRETMAYRGKNTEPRAIQDGTIWTELGHLRTVLIWAHKRRLISFAPEIERPAKPAPKERWLTEGEIETFLDAPAAPHIDLACRLMLSTAARVGAILDLKWERVDLETGVINLRASDTGPRKGRAVVPMTETTRGMLATAREMALTDYVIEYGGEPVKSIKNGFKSKVETSGLKDVTPHVLRHTAAVHLAKAGVPMERISQYLGHSNTSVTERVYARFAPDHMREEAEILDFGARKRKVG